MEKTITGKELKKITSAKITNFSHRTFGFISLAGFLAICYGLYIQRFNFGGLNLILTAILFWRIYHYLIDLEVNRWLKKEAKIDINIGKKGAKNEK